MTAIPDPTDEPCAVAAQVVDHFHTKTCSLPECEAMHYAKGYCVKHYQRNKKYGDPRKVSPKSVGASITRRILHQSKRDPETGCWNWTGARNFWGYGFVMVQGTQIATHRLFAEHRHGPCPEGQQCRHLCGNPSCFNPAHLRWGTPKENQADRLAHGTHGRGTNSGKAKLDDQTVRNIRRSKAKLTTLADFLGVAVSTVHAARSGQNWAWLDQHPPQ